MRGNTHTMKTLFCALITVMAMGCSRPYGMQSCKTGADCPTGQACILCNPPDAGAGEEVEGICRKTCSVDSECGDLGLSKPVCAKNSCGTGSCIDNPF